MLETPFYCFDLSLVRRAYKQMQKDLGDCKVFYCLKANGEAEIVRALSECGSSFEVSGVTEFNTVVSAGIEPEGILCGLPVKPDWMVRELYEKGCRYFVFDDIDEYRKLKQWAPDADKVLRLSMDGITDSEGSFGATINNIREWIDSSALIPADVTGLSLDVRKNVPANMVVEAIDRGESVIPLFPQLTSFNLGGNFRMSWEVDDLFYVSVRRRIAALRQEHSLNVIAEIGRSIVKHAGRLYCRVILVKKYRDSLFVYLDAGIPTGVTHGPTFVRPIETLKQKTSGDGFACEFFGPTCCHSLLFRDVLPAVPKVGDVLELGGMGAYTVCQRSAFHGTVPASIIYHDHLGSDHEGRFVAATSLAPGDWSQ